MSMTTIGTINSCGVISGEATSDDKVPGRIHVRARVLAERPLLRVESAGRDRDQRLPRRRLEGEDREALREDMREILERFFAGRTAEAPVGKAAATAAPTPAKRTVRRSTRGDPLLSICSRTVSTVPGRHMAPPSEVRQGEASAPAASRQEK